MVWPGVYQFDEPQDVAIKVTSTDAMASVGQDAAKILTEQQIMGSDSEFDDRSTDMLE